MKRTVRYEMLRKLALLFMFSHSTWFHSYGPLPKQIPLKFLPNLIIFFQNHIQAKHPSNGFLDSTPELLAITLLPLFLVLALPYITHQIELLLQPLLL